MALKKICRLWLLSFCILISSLSYAQFDQKIRHAVHINTRLQYIAGEPTWLLIIRDVKTGRILPFTYDFKDKTNVWFAFSTGREYRITVSKVKFGPQTFITNFCGLENGIIEGKSIFIRLTGALTPYRCTVRCRVSTYQDMGLTIVDGELPND